MPDNLAARIESLRKMRKALRAMGVRFTERSLPQLRADIRDSQRRRLRVLEAGDGE